jgi:hypothetical protein
MIIDENQLNEENKSFNLKTIKFEDKKLYEKIKILKNNNFNGNPIIFFTINIFEFIILGIPFILMDHFIRKDAKKIYFIVSQKYSYIFSYIYIFFFVFFSKFFKGNIGKIYYCLIFIFYFLLFLTNIIFFSFSSNFFHFSLLSYTHEGSHYIIGVILCIKIKIWINILIIIFSFILAVIIFRKSNSNKFLFFICFIVIFILSQKFTQNLLGPIEKKSGMILIIQYIFLMNLLSQINA